MICLAFAVSCVKFAFLYCGAMYEVYAGIGRPVTLVHGGDPLAAPTCVRLIPALIACRTARSLSGQRSRLGIRPSVPASGAHDWTLALRSLYSTTASAM